MKRAVRKKTGRRRETSVRRMRADHKNVTRDSDDLIRNASRSGLFFFLNYCLSGRRGGKNNRQG